ncbi:hypothetical protein KFE25_012754 [Diacronema lutheri]|uniref:Uncharacterized protein n=1 Tax=Diacronema lutheri TaxID=2081491 RepID=A0A8J6C239_DIALT|nr:hypothetical protein KFE25_012754 [Diacronema lutheri]
MPAPRAPLRRPTVNAARKPPRRDALLPRAHRGTAEQRLRARRGAKARPPRSPQLCPQSKLSLQLCSSLSMNAENQTAS